MKSGGAMKDLINGLLEGNFGCENGSLDFSCTKLELTLYKDEMIEDSFRIYGPKGGITKGQVFSSDMRMQCHTQEFIGEEEEIFYSFDAAGMEEGTVIKGEFYVISNQGEYYLPFVVSISHRILESSLGSIKNLFHFTNLAKSNWQEAMRLFYSPDFFKILTGGDGQYYQTYLGLSRYKGNEQNMEEFLLTIKKKQGIEYITSETSIRIEEPQKDAEYGFLITRNGWGYTRLEVSVEGNFLLPEKSLFTDDDFLGNGCKCRFRLKEEALHRGNNYGALILTTAYETIRIPVTAALGRIREYMGTTHGKCRITVQLMEYYQAFRLKKISTSTWQKETQKLVERLVSQDERDASARLFQAQLLISQERYNEAQWILEHAQSLMSASVDEDPVIWSYYMYLTTLINREEGYTNEIGTSVEELYRQYGGWRIAWLLLYLSGEYNKSASRKWMFLEEQFQRGCSSPVLYIEALLLLHVNPTLLMKLSDFEIQVLHYAAKMEVLTQEMTEQLQCLVPRGREYSAVLFAILKAAYKRKADKETLAAICSLLVKGGKVGAEYFPWYKLAVEKEIRLTRLYDYYMMSMDLSEQQPIHKMVLMYYSYHSDLSYERSAYLYADVHRRREEFQELYLTYLPQIEKFVVEQVCKLHINRDLAYLYKRYFKEQMVNEETALALSRLLFMHEIQIKRKDIDRVVVYQPRAGIEHYYPMSEGRALVPLFGADYTILFESSSHNRYVVSIAHTTELLILPGKLVKMLNGYALGEVGLNIYLCDGNKGMVQIEEENAERFLILMHAKQLREEYRREIAVKLVQFYYDHDRILELDEFLEKADSEVFTAKERSVLLRFMVLRGMYEKAYSWCCLYGPYDMDAKTIVRLVDYRVEAYGYREEETMIGMSIYAFRSGKYNETLLTYLIHFFRGMTKELRDIWNAARSFDVDTYELSEKIILQLLFSGSFIGEKMEIFKSYVRGGAKSDVEEAFLSQCAYDYFVRDRIMDSGVFEELLRVFSCGEELQLVCRLAVLKHYSDCTDEIPEEMKPLLCRFLDELLLEGIHLPFFGAYAFLSQKVMQLSDKTLIEYRATPGSKAVIHYIVGQESGDPGEYKTEEMNHVYGGVCFKEFQLFFGESVQYYIMEESESGSELTESGTIQKSDIEKGEDSSRYNLVNDIAIANTLQDYDTIDGLLQEYEWTDYLTKRLFTVI